jgi:CHAD domain-containing protein
LFKLALGIGLGAAAALAVTGARRARSSDRDHTDEHEGEVDRLGLGPQEPAAAGVHRMTVAQLDLAIRTLQGRPVGDPDLAVHETRKAIKRVRTLQRLRADADSRAGADASKALLREAAAALSGVRDAKVALETLESLTRRHPDRLTGAGVARLHAVLREEHHAAEQALACSGARKQALALLQATRAGVAMQDPRTPVTRRDTRAVDAGLLRLYGRGRKAMAAARKRKGIVEMHEWRKRVKDLRYAAEALARQQTAVAKQRRQARLRKVARRADKLAEALGEEHDLALLAKRVRGEDEIFRGDRASRKGLLRAIGRRRRQLRKRAFRAGFALYERKPTRWAKRLPKTR